MTFTDYAGRAITKKAGELCSKLSKDEGHTGYVGWIEETLRNPIEVWDRMDNGTMKRHYYSADYIPGAPSARSATAGAPVPKSRAEDYSGTVVGSTIGRAAAR